MEHWERPRHKNGRFRGKKTPLAVAKADAMAGIGHWPMAPDLTYLPLPRYSFLSRVRAFFGMTK